MLSQQTVGTVFGYINLYLVCVIIDNCSCYKQPVLEINKMEISNLSKHVNFKTIYLTTKGIRIMHLKMY